MCHATQPFSVFILKKELICCFTLCRWQCLLLFHTYGDVYLIIYLYNWHNHLYSLAILLYDKKLIWMHSKILRQTNKYLWDKYSENCIYNLYIYISAVPTVEKDSMMAFLTEMLHRDLFFQEAWDLPNVWVQLQEENKTFRRVEKCIFKIFFQ